MDPTAPIQETSTPAPEASHVQAKAEPPSPMAAPQQQAVPDAPVAQPPPKSTNPIPAMNNPRVADLFNRMDRDGKTVEHVVNIDGQNTLSGEVYDLLQQISTSILPITRINFIRVWKTLLLKRVQDIYENQYKQRPDNYVRLNRQITMPAPLADLLHTLGSFYSSHTGRHHYITPPVAPARKEPFWNVDINNIRDWESLTRYMDRNYTMREFPSQRETDARAIVLTYRQDTNTHCRIKALTNEPRLADAFIRLTNDDLFLAHNRFTIANCALNMTADVHTSNVRGRYTAGYILRKDI